MIGDRAQDVADLLRSMSQNYEDALKDIEEAVRNGTIPTVGMEFRIRDINDPNSDPIAVVVDENGKAHILS
jgi:hypothetical protein